MAPGRRPIRRGVERADGERDDHGGRARRARDGPDAVRARAHVRPELQRSVRRRPGDGGAYADPRARPVQLRPVTGRPLRPVSAG